MCAIDEGGWARRHGMKELLGSGDDCGRRRGEEAIKVEKADDTYVTGLSSFCPMMFEEGE